MKVVIIGNGIAGISVASNLRKLEPDSNKLTVEIYAREPYEYYARIRLPEIFDSRLNASDIQIYRPQWYAEKKIAVYKNQEVAKIEREKQEIVLRNETRVHYDKLVLCMGSDSYKPSIPNLDLHGVFSVREFGDAEAIRNYITFGTKHAVILGGGLLGLEIARHLVDEVQTVTVVELFPHLLPKQMDETGANILQKYMVQFGCKFILGTEVTGLLGDRKVTGLQLKNGVVLPAETVLIAMGVRPRIKLAKEAGLSVSRGVIVNEYLCTDDQYIFAAGDCVEFQGVVWGIIPAALDHAPVVAHNILWPNSVQYRQTIPQNTLKVAGIDLLSAGKVILNPGEEAESYRIIAELDEKMLRYEKYVLKDQTLLGSIIVGSRENQKFVLEMMGKKVCEAEITSRLWTT